MAEGRLRGNPYRALKNVDALLRISRVAGAPAPVEVYPDLDDAVVEVGHSLRAIPVRTHLTGQGERTGFRKRKGGAKDFR